MRALILFALLFTAPLYLVRDANADPGAGSGSSSIVVTAGSGSQSTTVATATTSITNADQLHDVLSDPLGALSDVKSLYNVKLSLAVLAVLILLTRAVARIPGAIGTWFSTGTKATVIAGVLAVAVAAFNGLLTGASWMTVLITAGAAVLALLHPVPAAKVTA